MILEGDLDFEFDSLNSEIHYYPSKAESGDGKRHGRFYIDEFGKKKMLDALAAWKFVKKSMVDDIYGTMAGKALFTSTIEEMKDGESLKISKKIWNDSDPDKLTPKGETVTGLIRVVRGVLEKGKTDRWGFSDEAAILEEIRTHREFLIKEKKWGELITHQRQECIDIKDVFTNVSDGSSFNIENLTNRLHRLEFEIKPDKWVRGNFEWVGGISPVVGDPDKRNKRCRVYFEPNENGRFYVTGVPEDWGLKANAMDMFSMKAKPNNIHAFAMGIDPVSQKDVVSDESSDSAFSIKRLLDPIVDGGKFDDNGNPLNFGEDFITNRYCCVYVYRHQNPEDNFMDWLKAMIFYGTDFLIEKNKGDSFLMWMESMGMENYYQDLGDAVKNYQGKTEKHGLSASEKVIESYFTLLRIFSEKWYNTIDIPLICEDMKSTKMGNQTEHDLTVSLGFCEIAAQNKTFIKKPVQDQYTYDEYFQDRIV